MEIFFAFFVTVFLALVTDLGERWDALSEPPDWSNLGLGRQWFGILVLAADLLGLILSGLSLPLSFGSWASVPIITCFAFVVIALVTSFVNRRGWWPKASQREKGGSIRHWKTALLLAAFIGAFFLGTFFRADDNSEPLVKWSRYHVEATQTNGAGFVNVCASPSPCTGKNPIGRMREGEPVYIECQLKGEPAETIAGDKSWIWDRLEAGGFVSDLFVSTPGEGRFSARIDRCVPWK